MMNLMDCSLTPLSQGLALNLGLIVAIGAQNAFVLRQGLQRQHVLTIAALSIILNVSLAVAGVYGVGFFISRSPTVKNVALWGGALFLLYYGFLSFKSAIRPKVLNANGGMPNGPTLGKIVASTLAFSWLNPHALLDNIVLIGSVGGQLSLPQRPFFLLGIFLAELLWFSALALFSHLLSSILKRAVVWRWLDIIIGCIMAFIAASLIASYFR